MKHTGIHILDFNDRIIDYISREDGALISASMSSNAEDKSEIFDFTVLNERAENLRERNRIITQDNNGVYREFIISHVVDNFDGTTDIESNASYFEDIDKSKPVKPGEYNQYSASQSLKETLRDTGWEVADSTEYNGMKTPSWDNYSTPYEIINILCDTYGMVADYYIELGSNTVEHRYVSLHEPYSLFKGKEITKGKDLTGMTRTVDMAEVRTALYVVGPEVEGKKRFETVVTDDEAQSQFGLPERYLWDVFEPETTDDSLSNGEIIKQAKEALNQRNKAAISYDISSIDIHKHYPEMTISLRDTVRIKDRDFRPPLYIEAEVIGVDYDLIQDESTYKFGNVVEYKESNLRAIFDKRFSDINKKLNDNISNVNTIVNDVVAGELEYYERKIFKGAEPPENPQEDVLWYDTSNSNVAVLRRYRNGKWQEETVSNVEQIGGVTREKALYSELNNTFINLGIQHSKLMNEVYDLLNNEYLVDTDLRNSLSNELNNVDNIYNSIKNGLDSITPETATIGRLIDIQALFGKYREALQSLYRASENAKDSANAKLKLLQSQYTDQKFNDAMDKIARTLPNGRWDSENQQLYADIPNRNEVENLKTTLQEYTDGQISDLNSFLGKEIDSKINTTKSEISSNISSIERKIEGIEVGGINHLQSYYSTTQSSVGGITKSPYYVELNASQRIYFYFYDRNNGGNPSLKQDTDYILKIHESSTDIKIGVFYKKGSYSIIGYTTDKIIRFNTGDKEDILIVVVSQSDDQYIGKISLYEGTKELDWSPAPEDMEKLVKKSQQDAEEAAQAYADAQDNLQLINAKAYADGIVSDEEQRAISDAIAKRDEAKAYAEQKAQEAQVAANQNTINQLKPITTRVTSNETSISELDKKIGLMAKGDDVTQQLKNVDGRLTPLETTVQNNKATLDILPTQIESKVSKQDYTLDKNEIVQRLDNADSQRKQLSNEITDKVTITKFESGMKEAKNYTDNIKKETEKYTDNQINNLDVGSENLLLNSESRSDGANSATYSFIRYYLAHPLEVGKTYTLKANIVTTDERQSGQVSIYPYFPNGTRDTVDIKGGKIAYTFTAQSESTQFLIYKDVAGQSSLDLNVTIEKAILVEGDKVTGWAPANEDVKKDIQQAETSAKAYTDTYKQKNDVAMTKLETSVSQLDGKVSIKVDEQKFNASQKTLSKVLTEIAATTSGINLSYDNNGTIQGVTVDNGGVKLRGDKVDITVNDAFRVMSNRVSNVQTDVSNKVGKNEIINRLNLSPEGLDIDVNKVALRGGDNINYVYLSQDKFEMAGTFQRTWQGDTQKDNVYMRAQNGLLRFRNNSRDRSIYYSDFGISTFIDGDSDGASGTIQFFDYTYSPTNSVRGITVHSAGGAVALRSERNRITFDANATINVESETASLYFRPMKNTRAGVNEFRMWTKYADKENETDGVLSYGAVTELPDGTLPSNSMGASLRFEKNPRGSSTVYATNVNGDIGTGNFYANRLFGEWTTKSSNLYAQVLSELRVTDLYGYNGGKPNYKDLRVNAINTTSSYAFSNHSGADTYFGVGGGELIITNNNHYNGGKPSYKNIRFGKWYAMSSEKFKYDIKEWNYSVLDAYRNDLQLYSYKYKSEKDSKYIRNHHGVIIERELPIEWRHGDGFDGNEVMFWNTKAIQELLSIVDKQSKQIEKLEEKLNG